MNQAWLTLLGPWILMTSLWSIIGSFIPGMKPDIDMEWDDMDDFSRFYTWWVAFVARMGEPNLFFLTQIFTWGDSNFRDISVYYMTEVEGAIYFIYNSMYISLVYGFANMHFALFWWIYGIQFIWWLVKELFMEDKYDKDDKKDSKKGGKGDKGGKKGPKGKKDGMDSDDDY